VIYISGGIAELRLWISYPAFLAWRIFGVFGILGMANIPIYRRLPTYQSPSSHSHPSSQFYSPSFPKLLAAHQAFYGSLCPSSPFCKLFIHPVLELSKLIFYWSSRELASISELVEAHIGWSSQSSCSIESSGAPVLSELVELISHQSSRSSCCIGS